MHFARQWLGIQNPPHGHAISTQSSSQESQPRSQPQSLHIYYMFCKYPWILGQKIPRRTWKFTASKFILLQLVVLPFFSILTSCPATIAWYAAQGDRWLDRHSKNDTKTTQRSDIASPKIRSHYWGITKYAPPGLVPPKSLKSTTVKVFTVISSWTWYIGVLR